eukprot:g3100.t1
MDDTHDKPPRLVCGMAGMVNFSPAEGDDKTETSLASLAAHVAQGITELDMADIYPGVEEVAGLHLRRQFGGCAASIARDSVTLLTKFVPDKKMLGAGVIDAGYVRRVVQRSCNRLGVDAVDRVQLHWWDYGADGYVRVAQALTALAAPGEGGSRPLLRSADSGVGVTNCDTEHVRLLVDAGVRVGSAQVQLSLVDKRPLAELAPYCAARGIELLAYGALAGGLLSDAWLGAEDPAASGSATAAAVPPSAKKYLALVGEGGGWAPFQATLRACRAVADALGGEADVATVALAWVLAQPAVGAAIVGGGSGRHIGKSLAARAAAPRLTAAQLAQLEGAAAAAGGTALAGDCYAIERDTSTASGAALAPWTDVGTLAKPPHFEELKRRAAALERAAGAAGPGARTAVAGVAGVETAAARALEELRCNFGGTGGGGSGGDAGVGAGAGATGTSAARAALSDEQRNVDMPQLAETLTRLAGGAQA